MTTSVEEMSDDQLFEALKENGFAPGPIVDSTRAIYRKKLLAIINNDVKEASEEEEEEEEVVEEEEDDQPSGIESPVADHVASGLRQRFGAADQIDSGDLLRSTPTPRNVHNYTEIQTTSQNVVKTKNGLETRDTTRTVEKTETKAGSGPGWITALATRLFQLALLCLILGAAYYIFTKMPTDDGVVKNVQDAMKEAAAREEKQSVV